MDHVVAHWVDRMLSSTLELKQMQTQPWNKLPGCWVTLVLGNNRGQRRGTAHFYIGPPPKTTVSQDAADMVHSRLMSEKSVIT